MKEQLQAILTEVENAIPGIVKRSDFEAFKATISGPKGKLTDILKGMKNVPKEDRPAMGKLINEYKTQIEAFYTQALENLDALELAALIGPPIDPSLPSPDPAPGLLHPLTQTRRRMDDVFRKIGFTVAEGPEVETEWFCFDALNTPEDHPARDEQDTLFMPEDAKMGNVSKRGEERYILRSHTSTVQIRTMLAEKPPLRIISPGRVFRRDTSDATHSANFHQCEGLYIDREVTIKDLKAVLDYFVAEIFGKGSKVRLRPSFFPFTEPSFELDMMTPNLGKLSNQWIELGGCGMVDPKVFDAVGINSGKWTGFAFGMGVERIAMILHGIDDIRHFYNNDLRFLRQFA
ncbi:phenylalanine--tRNA ligase subunit alpha [Cerasicoccus arenae]|uniref:Phenylalanine--tRNA ligase alpha subunit n=1 Tax=Cerasicoccus arenae TaxID=424488 RepID=A0A8J3D9B0_9BACT|nr:phenylalanine--tRNA ligase subunit alpha [Cerasicoccus arenae]MBK1857086.1 phenylalanine--tRNA ligase subunit alpha [Cerasicoccus arenae]GHB92287.1 phenylalanine--tRNA ligase alpha subunit [Cerasicoccus arenae]